MDEIKQVMIASASRKQERADRAKAEDFDVEEGELVKEENELEEEIFDRVCFVTQYLISFWLFDWLIIFVSMTISKF